MAAGTERRFLPAGAMRRIVVLGAGRLAVTGAEFARGSGIAVEVFGAPRQADARLPDGRSVADVLAALGAAPRYVESIRDCAGGPYDGPADGAVILSLGSPFIIGQDLIDVYEGRVINSHGSLLPEWRGGGGFSWRILAGDRRGNSCFHLVTPGIDDGDVVLERAYTFPPKARTPQEWMDYALKQDAACLGELLEGIRDGRTFAVRRQDEARSTYFPRLDSHRQGYIDWSWPGEEIERFILAFSHPYDGAKTFVGEQTVRLFDGYFSADSSHPHGFFHGLILRASVDSLAVACTGGMLTVARAEIITDAELKPGDRLVTPAALLEEALRLRPRYTPKGLVA